MLKKYISKTHACINVTLSSGEHRHISFTPQTGESSVFYTRDYELQRAMESHYKVGRLFRLEQIIEPDEECPSVRPQEKEQDNQIVKMQMSDAELAKNYLADKYGVSRTKMKSVSKIKEIGLSNGIEFIGF